MHTQHIDGPIRPVHDPLTGLLNRAGLVVRRLQARNAELEALLAAAEHRATHDPLTGLLNRAGLVDRWPTVPTGTPVALVDVDRFKQINDTYGHAAGDHVLTVLADRIRPYGLAVRLAGDELVLIGPDAGRVSTVWPMQLPSGVRLRVTLSVGVAPAGSDMAATLAAADAAMYRAKATGRGRVVAHDRYADERPALEDRPAVRLRDTRPAPHPGSALVQSPAWGAA